MICKKNKQNEICMLFFLVQLLIILSEHVMLQNVNVELKQWCQIFTIFVLINILIQICCFLYIGLLNLGSIITLVSHLFQCSWGVLIALNAVPNNNFIYTVFLKNFGNISFMKGSLFGLESIGFFFLGYIILAKTKKKKNNVNNAIGRSYYKSVGKLLTFVFGTIYYTCLGILLYTALANKSYLTISHLTDGVLSPFMNLQMFYYAGLYLLAVGYKIDGEKGKRNVVCAVGVISVMVQFMTGARSLPMLYLIVFVLFFAKDCYNKEVKKSRIVVLVFLLFFVLNALVAVRSVRQGNLSVHDVVQSFFGMDRGIVFETMNEFGASVCVTSALMRQNMHGSPGDYIVKELFSVLPRISSWGGKTFLAPTVITGIKDRYAIGSTCIADFYYYFGSLGSIVMSTLGLWIAFIEKRFERLRAKGEYLSLTVFFCWSVAVLNNIRSTSTMGLKILLYSFIIVKAFEAFRRRGIVSI